MSILGVGVDIVSINRIERIYRTYGDAFLKRILSEREHDEFEKVRVRNRPAWLAKHFAAKEAVAKALGTGFSSGVSLRRIAIAHEPSGKPRAMLTGPAGERLIGNHAEIHVSIADEQEYAIAYAVISNA